MTKKLAVVVVTFNRLDWLNKNLKSLLNQTKKIDKIYIIDNCSTDETPEFLKRTTFNYKNIVSVSLDKNYGGAGGFYYGLKKAYEDGNEWICLMDDDCILESDCIEKMFKHMNNKKNAYIPLELDIETRSKILLEVKYDKENNLLNYLELGPFNAFTVHRDLINKIGFPEKEYFIYGDDDEYSLRIRKNGGKIRLIKDAILYHPNKVSKALKKIGKIKYTDALLSPLRAYYCTRNSVLNNKKYGEMYKGISIVNLMKNMFKYLLIMEFKLIKLTFNGYLDGILGKKISKGPIK
ncbi:glycosyltransferase [uncultured Ilyobacter sp.]|uniref:glycosyltransferase n=1 Tax=uncultured Ilyobacter sp. TaxID=544433 RepID=UPI0029F5C8E9|nr:glycosyltransferase [uncultured Ilyobacter sp.]